MIGGLAPRAMLLPALLLTLVMSASNGPEAGAIAIDYPEEGSLFPPEITPPAFLWRDGGKGVTRWRIDVAFGDRSPALHATSAGPRLRIGRIDPDCIADTSEPPKLTPRLAAAHSWTPEVATW